MVTVGIDEVGRGCWAGPLVAAAVALNDTKNPFWEDCPPKAPKGGRTLLRDSKTLSRKQREEMENLIKSQVKTYGVGWVKPGEIDEIGLTKSVQLAMLRAMMELHKACRVYDEIIIDGNYNFFAAPCTRLDLAHFARGLTSYTRTMVGADGKVPAVSAASIIAKVARDTYMAKAAQRYPDYGFEKHVGYGTSVHMAALKSYGVTDLHRRSFKPVRTFL